jgi:guanosine-3',5'-bis(diphosphate) 3'-pyrophosphohydrolase
MGAVSSDRGEGSSVAIQPPPVEVDKQYRELEDLVRRQRPDEDLSGLRAAYEFAAEVHRDQKRVTGEPYVTHPIAVAQILAERNMDLVCLQTALLHDTVEDTGCSIEEIAARFGNEVAHCVGGVTKLGKVKLYSREERQAESVRKMLLAMMGDIRVILVKLADRLHNMRTLQHMPRDKQVRTAQETLEIYAPIAHRLGMGKLRGELEDLAFRFLEPEAAAEIEAEVKRRVANSEAVLAQMRETIKTKLSREGIPATVDGRIKRAYSVWQKLKRQHIGIDQVYDLLALRIITDSVKNCYAALGVIHNEWPPIPGRIKDFIAIPRPNLYQSLHTSVIGPGGIPFEIQIRTEEMHKIAEEGIAAHWKYKEGRKGPGVDDQRIAWLRQLVEWQREMRDPGDFMSTLKVDLYPEEVYCFTPRGKVIVLPRDATPIDFAYAIHTDVGHGCVGAKVNGRIVPLRTALKNGDVVEILTQAGHKPSKDWLALVKTSRARQKIRQVINVSERERAIEIGQKAMEREARRLGIQLGRINREDLDRVAGEYGLSKLEDLYAALGYGKYSARQVLQKLAPEIAAAVEQKEAAKAARPPTDAADGAGDPVIRVGGLDDLMVYRAKCCNPIRGEPIVGYITRGKGVAVHSVNCSNVVSLLYEAERKVEVEWARTGNDLFAVKIVVYAEDKPGTLNQLTTILSQENSNIRSLEARTDDRRGNHDCAIVDMTIEIRDKRQLERITAAMRRISGVRDVERVQ